MATARNRWAQRVWGWIEGRATSGTAYFLIVASTLALTAIGVVMVLSASSVENIGGRGSYASLTSQGVYALVGIVLMFWLSRWRPETLRRYAWLLVIVAFVLLLLVFSPLGREINGNQNWIFIGGFSFQPSEAAKLALAVWGAHVLAMKGKLLQSFWHAVLPLVPVGGLIVLLVLLGRDLGTVLVLLFIVAALLFMSGFKLRYLGLAAAIGLAAVTAAALTSENRRVRIDAWLGQCDHATDPCYQYQHGIYALASGGWWGAGIGQSRQKWSYIPEAENDFIFTILGEELGLVGALLVIALFIALAIAFFRVAYRAETPFIRICTGAIMAWLIGQAFLNIAMVTGLLPVIGVPLPFISAGGSALMLSLMAIGVVLSFAREERRLALHREKSPSDPSDTRGTPATKVH